MKLTSELTAFGLSEPAKPRVTDLKALLERYRGLLAMAAGPESNPVIDAEPIVGWVFIDPVQMERVLLDLVLNARDALPAGGIIGISLRNSSLAEGANPESVHTVLEIRDNGSGIDDATREKMFEPFFTTKGPKGTGLGLAIVMQIVTQAGGSIKVETAPQGGTRISLHLPNIGSPQS